MTTKPIHSFFRPKQKKRHDDPFEITLSELASVKESKRQRRSKHDASNSTVERESSRSSSVPKPLETVDDRLQRMKKSDETKFRGETDRKFITDPPKIVVVDEDGQRIIQNESKEAGTSSLDMASVEQQSIGWEKRSILHQLLARSTSGTKIRRQRSQTTNAANPTAWTPCPWLVLMASSATAMSFDPEGVLLAVATPIDKKIIIYDWDTVMASDLRGRIDGRKDVMQPMLQFRVPHPVSQLQWDTNDHLLVTYRGTPVLHVYNMAIIAENPSSPRAAVTNLRPAKHMVKYQGPKCASFLPGNHHIVACYPCGSICLWNLQSSSLTWTYKNSTEPVSSMLPLSNNLLLLGGTEGGFVLLDWRKTKRAAFASDKTPTIVTTWKTHTLLAKQKYAIPTGRDLSVQTLSMDLPVSTNNVDLIGACQITWITSGGWCLSTDLGRRKRIKVLDSPPKLKTLTFEGVRCSSGTKCFSSPIVPVLASSQDAGLLWEAVAETTHVLPHHDKRVCQQREVRRSSEMWLCWMDGDVVQKCVSRVALRRQPTSLTIHPGREWMIVATQSKLVIYNIRSHGARRKSIEAASVDSGPASSTDPSDAVPVN